jgi:hypothetical protein
LTSSTSPLHFGTSAHHEGEHALHLDCRATSAEGVVFILPAKLVVQADA